MAKVGNVVVGVSTAVGILTLILGYFEGSRPVAYLDPIGIPTVCIGHTGPEVVVGRKSTPEECLKYLDKDLQVAWHVVAKYSKVPLAPWEQVAYASFVFNLGEKSFAESTLLKKLNSGDHVGACNELSKWVNAHGKPLPGLVKRREFERQLCLGHDVILGK